MFMAVERKNTIREPGTHPRKLNAYDKFMAGYDTMQLAEIYHISEATALRWISQERSRRRAALSPYVEAAA